MFDRIVFIDDKGCTVKLNDAANITMNLMNLHLIFEDDKKKILGEVDDLDGDLVKARFLGEIVDNKVVSGTLRKPSIDSKVRVIEQNEIPMVCGNDTDGFMKLGNSPFYDGFPVYLDVNNFFSNHFAIFGNTGSGKSCGVTRLFQNMFHDQRLYPYKANILLFDSSGEYYNAFSNLSTINPNYHYRFITTNETDNVGEKLRLPIYLLNAQDLALLLQCTSHSQLPIIERMLKLALIFSQKDMDANKYKNHLIAKAIMTILYTNETSPNKRNEIFSILASCSTPQFNLEAPVAGIGYTRKFRECFLIDNKGQFSESVLLTEYVTSFINEKFDDYEPKPGVYYTLDTLEKALNFTLISEGWLRNTNTYGDAVTIRVRLHALIVGTNAKFFDVKEYVSLEDFLSSLILNNGKKYQIININLDDVDDDFAKVITKVYSRLVFEFAKGLKNRASIPFHIIVEEAHRYIQNDTDRFLIGYNIFERIAKEGRKYGVILGLISQRPVELSDTVISQCSNFLIFKMNHPVDVEYIRKMVPNISDEIVEKQKTLQSGTCLGFGLGFRIPLIVRMEMPNPAPWSGNANVVEIWKGNGSNNVRSAGGPNGGGTILNPTIPSDLKTGFNMNGIQDANVNLVDVVQNEFVALKEDTKKSESNGGPTTDTGVPLVDVKTDSNNNSNNNGVPTTDTGVPLVGGSSVSNNNNMPKTDTGVPLVGGSDEPVVELEKPLIDLPENGGNSSEPSLTPLENVPKTDTGVPLVDVNGSGNSNDNKKNNAFDLNATSLGSIQEGNAKLLKDNSNESFAEPELLLAPAKSEENGTDLSLDETDDSDNDNGFDEFNE